MAPIARIEDRTQDPDGLLALFEAMAEIDALCANLAAQRAHAADLPGLEEMLQGMAVARPADYPDLNFELHDRVCAMARNAELARIAQALRLRLAPVRRIQLGHVDRQRRSLREHRALVDALGDRNGALAAGIMRAHLRVAMREVLFL